MRTKMALTPRLLFAWILLAFVPSRVIGGLQDLRQTCFFPYSFTPGALDIVPLNPPCALEKLLNFSTLVPTDFFKQHAMVPALPHPKNAFSPAGGVLPQAYLQAASLADERAAVPGLHRGTAYKLHYGRPRRGMVRRGSDPFSTYTLGQVTEAGWKSIVASGASYTIPSFLTIPINYDSSTNSPSPFLLFIDSRGSPSLVWNYVSDPLGKITAIQIACVNASGADPKASEAFLASNQSTMGGECMNVFGPSSYRQLGRMVQLLGRWEETHGRMQLYVQGLVPVGATTLRTWRVNGSYELNADPMSSTCGIVPLPDQDTGRTRFISVLKLCLTFVVTQLLGISPNSSSTPTPLQPSIPSPRSQLTHRLPSMFPAKNPPLLPGRWAAAGNAAAKHAGRGRSTLGSATDATHPTAAGDAAAAVAAEAGEKDQATGTTVLNADAAAAEADEDTLAIGESDDEADGYDPVIGGFLSWLSELEGSGADDYSPSDEPLSLSAAGSVDGHFPSEGPAGDSLVSARGLSGGFGGRSAGGLRGVGGGVSGGLGRGLAGDSARGLSSPIGPKVQGGIGTFLCKHTHLFCLQPVVQVQNASGSFVYDGEHRWSLQFDAIFDILPGYNLKGHKLLQRLADDVHPHLGFKFGSDETYPNPLAFGSFTYDSAAGFLSMQFRTTAAGFFIVRAAAEEIHTLTGIDIPVPDESVALPSFGTYGIFDKARGLRFLFLSLNGTFSVGRVARACGFNWPLPQDFVSVSDAYLLFIAAPGLTFPTGGFLPPAFRGFFLVDIPYFNLTKGACTLSIAQSNYVFLSFTGSLTPIPAYPGFSVQDATLVAVQDYGMTGNLGGSFFGSQFDVSLFVGNHPSLGIYVTASIAADHLSLSNVITGVAGPQAAALAEFLSPFNFRSISGDLVGVLKYGYVAVGLTAVPDFRPTSNTPLAISLVLNALTIDYVSFRLTYHSSTGLDVSTSTAVAVKLPNPFVLTASGTLSLGATYKQALKLAYITGTFNAYFGITGMSASLALQCTVSVEVWTQSNLLNLAANAISAVSLDAAGFSFTSFVTMKANAIVQLKPLQFQTFGMSATGEFFLGSTANAYVCIAKQPDGSTPTGLQVSVFFRLQSLFNAMGVVVSLGAFDFTAAATLTYASQSLTYDCLGANRFIPSGYTVQGTAQLFGLFTVIVNFQIQPKGRDGDFAITITSQIQQRVSEIISGVLRSIRSAIVSIWDSVMGALGVAWDWTKNAFKSIVNCIISFFTNCEPPQMQAQARLNAAQSRFQSVNVQYQQQKGQLDSQAVTATSNHLSAEQQYKQLMSSARANSSVALKSLEEAISAFKASRRRAAMVKDEAEANVTAARDRYKSAVDAAVSDVVTAEGAVHSLRLFLFSAVSSSEREALQWRYDDALSALDDARQRLDETRAGPLLAAVQRAQARAKSLSLELLQSNGSREAVAVQQGRQRMAATQAVEAAVNASAAARVLGSAAAAAQVAYVEQRAFYAGNASQWYGQAKTELDQAQYIRGLIEDNVDATTGRAFNDSGDPVTANLTAMNEKLAAYMAARLSNLPSSNASIFAGAQTFSGGDIFDDAANYIVGILFSGFSINSVTVGYHYKGKCCASSYADLHMSLRIMGFNLNPSFTIDGSFMNGLINGVWNTGRGLINLFDLVKRWVKDHFL